MYCFRGYTEKSTDEKVTLLEFVQEMLCIWMQKRYI